MRGVLVSVMLVIAVWGAVPAAARQDGGEPDLVDECGVTERSDRTALPWQDLCAATFESDVAEDGTVTVTVTLSLDGEVDPRTPTAYEAIFSDGDCQYWLMHDDGDALTAPTNHAQVRCGPGEVVTCDPEVLEDLGFFCFTIPDPTFHNIGFVAEGRTAALTFVTSEATTGLPLSEGDMVDSFSVATAQSVAGEGMWNSQCREHDGRGSECTSDVGDHAWTSVLGHSIGG